MANESNIPLEEILYSTPEDTTMECGSTGTCHDFPSSGAEDVHKSDSPAARVLSHLDDVLRQRLNLELEEFQESLHNILDEQLCHVRRLVSISQPAVSQGIQEVVTGAVENKGGDAQDYYPQVKYERTVDSDDTEKTRIVLQLLTLCSSISRKLQTLT